MKKHWQTTLLGLVAITIGLWSMHCTYVPSSTLTLWQTIRFNTLYVWPGQLALIIAGIGLLLAADARHVK